MVYHKKETVPACLECGRAVYGRKDKKFCSEGCKNRWHNRKMHVYNKLRLKTLNALDRNYGILSRLLREGVRFIDRADLAQLGFRPDCVTSHCRVRGHDEYRCFDIKYILTASRVRMIERTPVPLSEEEGGGFVLLDDEESGDFA